MSLPLYTDHHLKAEVIAGLRRMGLDVLTAREDHRDRAPDEQLLERATALGRILCTEDKDFFGIASRWWRASREFTAIIRVRQHGVGIGVLIEDIAVIAQSCTPDEVRNRILYVSL